MRTLLSFVVVLAESGDLISFVEKVRCSGIPIYDLRIVNELQVKFTVSSFDYGKIRKIAADNDCEVKILKRAGYIWFLRYAMQRKVLLWGIVFVLVLTLCIPTRVLFVQVDGNHYLHSAQIAEAAEGVGIRFGTSRRSVRSEKVKNALLESIPHLQWAGITTSGCVAKIVVRERSVSFDQARSNYPDNIVAAFDGVITSCTAVKGNLLCNVGQTVTAGEKLISGYVDCGGYIRKTGAEGEVYANTQRSVSASFPKVWRQQIQQGDKHRSYSIILGKKRINLWKGSGISDVSYDRIYKEYYAVLPGGFRLPIALAIDSWLSRQTEKIEIPEEEIISWLKIYAENYLRTQMLAGEICAKRVEILKGADGYSLEGEYSCSEMIGRVQQEEIGAAYE